MGRSTATHPGDRLGTLVAVCPTEERYHGSVVWKWRCDCGEERLGIAAYLRQQLLRCGHLRCPRCRSKTQPGDRLGSLVAVRPTRKAQPGKNRVGVAVRLRRSAARGCGRSPPGTTLSPRLSEVLRRQSYWLCRCECGREARVRGILLVRGKSQECLVCRKGKRVRDDGERSRRARKRAGLTLAEASALVGISRQRWHQFELIDEIRPTQLAKLLAAIKGAKS